jgi:hypothetical protein
LIRQFIEINEKFISLKTGQTPACPSARERVSASAVGLSFAKNR